jgi:hypothetical protein
VLKCCCGKLWKKRKEWKNLLAHIHVEHSDALQQAKKPDARMVFFFRNKDSNVCSWLVWVIEDLLPLMFCERSTVRQSTKLDPISTETFKEPIIKCTLLEEKRIAQLLPSLHCILIPKVSCGYSKVLVSLSPLLHEEI